VSPFDRVVGDRHRRELLAFGARAPATVIGVSSLGRTSAVGSLTEISLRIDPPGGKRFSRTIREWLPAAAAAGLRTGAVLAVRYDDRAVVLDAAPDTAGGDRT
jgi:hypothetical protein